MPKSSEKQKTSVWLYPETIQKVKELYRDNNCKNKSEFTEKALRFYIGYLTAENKENFLPTMFLSNMKSIVADSDNRMSRLLFKLAVELAIVQNIVAATSEVDEITMASLRGECVKEVKRLNGNFIFEDAIAWQKGN